METTTINFEELKMELAIVDSEIKTHAEALKAARTQRETLMEQVKSVAVYNLHIVKRVVELRPGKTAERQVIEVKWGIPSDEASCFGVVKVSKVENPKNPEKPNYKFDLTGANGKDDEMAMMLLSLASEVWGKDTYCIRGFLSKELGFSWSKDHWIKPQQKRK